MSSIPQRLSKHCSSISLSLLLSTYECPNGDIYTASREDCIDISTSVCASLWNLAISYGYGNKLPDCQGLPSCEDSMGLFV